jgi:hypothetical protein
MPQLSRVANLFTSTSFVALMVSGPMPAVGLVVPENTASAVTLDNLTTRFGSGYSWSLQGGNSAGGRVAIAGDLLVTTTTVFDYETSQSHSVTVVGTKSGASTIVQPFNISVTNQFEQPALLALSLSSSTVNIPATTGDLIGAINNTQAGSTVTIVGVETRVAISSGNLLVGASPPVLVENFDITFRETLADSPNSPRDTTITITAQSASYATITPGSTAYRSWAIYADNDPLIVQQGNSGDYGYAERAIANWMAPSMYRTVNAGGELIIGVDAWKAPTVARINGGDERGIKEVHFSCNNGPWTVVSTPQVHPLYGDTGYLAKIREADFTSSGPVEIRALVIPWVGKPFMLQGRDASGPANATTLGQLTDTAAGPGAKSIDPRTMTGVNAGTTVYFTALTRDSWSFIANVNKNAGADKLPTYAVYIDTVNATGLANDANNGQSAATPVLTWERAFNLAETEIATQIAARADAAAWTTFLNGAKEIGGTTFYITGAANNHILPGFAVARPLYNCRHQNVNFRRAPGLSYGQVKFSQKAAVAAYMEKTHWEGLQFLNISQPVASANTVWACHGSHAYENCFTDGGATNLVQSGENWDGTGDIYVGLPKGESAFRFYHGYAFPSGAAGHSALINCRMDNVGYGNVWSVLTLNSGLQINNLSSAYDLFGTPKYMSNVVVRGVVSRQLQGGNHMDGIQPYGTNTNYGNIIVKDFDGRFNEWQHVYWDGNPLMNDIAFIRGHYYGQHNFSVNAPMFNAYILRPTFVASIDGQANIARVWPDTHAFAPARAVRAVSPDASSVFKSNWRRGLSYVQLGVTTSEPYDTILPTEFDAASPLAVFDVEGPLNEIVTTNPEGFSGGDEFLGVGTPRMARLVNIKAPTYGWAQIDANDARRPVYYATGFGGRPMIRFTAVNGGSIANGDSNLYDLTNSARDISGTAEREIWYIFNFREPDTGLPANRGDRYMFEPSNNRMRVTYDIVSGSRRLKILSSDDLATTTGNVSCLFSNHSLVNGLYVLRIKLYADKLAATLYNSANPNGIDAPETAIVSPRVKSIVASKGTISGWANGQSGFQATFVQHDLNAIIITPRLDGNPTAEAQMLAATKARIGLPAQAITFGTTPIGSWAATTYTTPEGNSGDRGYNERAIGAWATPMFDEVTGVYYAGVSAWKMPTFANYLLGKKQGIKEVRFSANNGPWLTVTTPQIHPTLGTLQYLCPIVPDTIASSQAVELRAIVIPDSGQPFVMQGTIDVRTMTPVVQGSSYRLATYTQDSWSMILNVNKPGATLPKLVLYKAPFGSGNDAANGLTAGAALNTWEAVFDKATTTLGSNLGGLEVRLTAGLNHEWGFNSSRSDYDTGWRQVKITRDPAVAKSAVRISSLLPFNIQPGRIRFEGITKNVMITIGASAQNQNSNYHDVCWYDVSHDGGAGVDGWNQPTGAAFAAQGSPTAHGFKEVWNVSITNSTWCDLFNVTAGANVTLSYISSDGDLFRQPKYLAKVNIRNITASAAPASNHIDCLQWVAPKYMAVIEDFDASIVGQGAFGDGSVKLTDVAIIRPKINTNGYNGPAFSVGSAPKNLYILEPQVSGSTQGIQTWDNTTLASGMIMASDSYIYAYDVTWRQGWQVYKPTTVVEPSDQLNNNTIWHQIASTKIKQIADVNLAETINWTQYDDAGTYYPDDKYCYWLRMPHDTIGWTMADAASPQAHKRRPKYFDSGFGAGSALPYLQFNGLGTTTGGIPDLSTLGSGPVYGFQNNNSVEDEIWFCGNHKNTITDTAYDNFFAMGNGANGTVSLFRSYQGGMSIIGAQMGQGNNATPPTAVASNISVGLTSSVGGFTGFAQGAFFVRVEMKLTSIVITLWNAQYPNGISATATMTAGYGKIASVNNRNVLGANCVVNTGSANTGATHDFNALIYTDALTTEQRDSFIAQFKTRIGI